MKCQLGLCLICEKEIIKKCSACDARTKTQDYTEVQLNWSNGSKMRVAVCVDCSKVKVWKADKVEMTKAHWDAWDKLGNTYDKAIVVV